MAHGGGNPNHDPKNGEFSSGSGLNAAQRAHTKEAHQHQHQIQHFANALDARQALADAGYTQKTSVGGKSVMGLWIGKDGHSTKVGQSLAPNFKTGQRSEGNAQWGYSARFNKK